MKTPYPLPYLLLYAAQINTEISPEEEALIAEKLKTTEDLEKVKAEFLNDDSYTRVQKIKNIFREGDKESLLREVKTLMKADEEFSGVENYLLNLMKRF